MGRDKEGKGGEGGSGREGRVWQRLVMGVGAGRVRGGCGAGAGIGEAAGRREPQGRFPPSGSGPAGPCRAGRAKELSAGRARGWVMGCGGSCTTPPPGGGGGRGPRASSCVSGAGRPAAWHGIGRAGGRLRTRAHVALRLGAAAGGRTHARSSRFVSLLSFLSLALSLSFSCIAPARTSRFVLAASPASGPGGGGVQRLPAQDAPPPPAAARAAPPASRHRAARAAGGPRAGAILPDGAGSVVMRDSTAAPSLELPSVSMRRRAMRRRATEGRGP